MTAQGRVEPSVLPSIACNENIAVAATMLIAPARCSFFLPAVMQQGCKAHVSFCGAFASSPSWGSPPPKVAVNII